jgi:hypothetical protein
MQLTMLECVKGRFRAAVDLAATARDEFVACGDQRGMIWSEFERGRCEILSGELDVGLERVACGILNNAAFEFDSRSIRDAIELALAHAEGSPYWLQLKSESLRLQRKDPPAA